MKRGNGIWLLQLWKSSRAGSPLCVLTHYISYLFSHQIWNLCHPLRTKQNLNKPLKNSSLKSNSDCLSTTIVVIQWLIGCLIHLMQERIFKSSRPFIPHSTTHSLFPSKRKGKFEDDIDFISYKVWVYGFTPFLCFERMLRLSRVPRQRCARERWPGWIPR